MAELTLRDGRKVLVDDADYEDKQLYKYDFFWGAYRGKREVITAVAYQQYKSLAEIIYGHHGGYKRIYINDDRLDLRRCNIAFRGKGHNRFAPDIMIYHCKYGCYSIQPSKAEGIRSRICFEICGQEHYEDYRICLDKAAKALWPGWEGRIRKTTHKEDGATR